MQMVGREATVTKDIQTSNGMLYQGSSVKVLEKKCTCTHGQQNILIEDKSARQFWVGKHDI